MEAAVDAARAQVLPTLSGDAGKQAALDALAAGLKDGVPPDLEIQPDAVVSFLQLDAVEVLGAAKDAAAGGLGAADREVLRALAEGHMLGLVEESIASAPPAVLAVVRAADGGLFTGFVQGLAEGSDDLDAGDHVAFATAEVDRLFDGLDAVAADLPPGPGTDYLGAVALWSTTVGREALARLPSDASAKQLDASGDAVADVVEGGVLGLARGFPEPALPLPAAVLAVAEGAVDAAFDALEDRPRSDAWDAWVAAVPAGLVGVLGDLPTEPTTEGAEFLRAWSSGFVGGALGAADAGTDLALSDVAAGADLAAAVGGDATGFLATAADRDAGDLALLVASYGAAVGAGLPVLQGMTAEAQDLGAAYLAGLAGVVTTLPPGATAGVDPGVPAAFVEGAVEGGLARIDAMDATAKRLVAEEPMQAFVAGLVAGAGGLATTPGADDLAPDLVRDFADGLATGYLDQDPFTAWGETTFDDLRHTTEFLDAAVAGASAQFVADAAWDAADGALAYAFAQSLGPAATAWAKDAKNSGADETTLTAQFAYDLGSAGAAAAGRWADDLQREDPPLSGKPSVPALKAYALDIVAAARDVDEAKAWASPKERLDTIEAFEALAVGGVGWVLDGATAPAAALVEHAAAHAGDYAAGERAEGAVAVVEGVASGLLPAARPVVGHAGEQPGILLPWIEGTLDALPGAPPNPTRGQLAYWRAWAAGATRAASEDLGAATAEQKAFAERYARELTEHLYETTPPDAPAIEGPLVDWAHAAVAGPLAAAEAWSEAEQAVATAWLTGLSGGASALATDLRPEALPQEQADAVEAWYEGASGPAAAFAEAAEGLAPGSGALDGLQALAAAFAADSVRILVADTASPRADVVTAWAKGTSDALVSGRPRLGDVGLPAVGPLAKTVTAGLRNLPEVAEVERYGAGIDAVVEAYAGAVADGAVEVFLGDDPTAPPATPGGTPAVPEGPDDPLDAVLWADALTDPLFTWPQDFLGSPPDASRVDRYAAFMRGALTGGLQAALDASEEPALSEIERAGRMHAWAQGLAAAAAEAAGSPDVDPAPYAAYLSGVAEGGVGAVVGDDPVAAGTDAVQAYAAYVASYGPSPDAGAAAPSAEPWVTYGRALASALADLPTGPLDARREAALAGLDAAREGLAHPPLGPTEAFLAHLDGWLRAEAGALASPPIPGPGDLEGTPSPEATAAFLKSFTEDRLWSIPPDASPFDATAPVQGAVDSALRLACGDADPARCEAAASAAAAAVAGTLDDAPADRAVVAAAVAGAFKGLVDAAPGAEAARAQAVAAASGALDGAFAAYAEKGGDPSAARAAVAAATGAAADPTSDIAARSDAVRALARATTLALLKDAAGDPALFPDRAEAAALAVAAALTPADLADPASLPSKVAALAADAVAGARPSVHVEVRAGPRTLTALDGSHWLPAAPGGHVVAVTPSAALRAGSWSAKWSVLGPDGAAGPSGTTALRPQGGAYAGALPSSDRPDGGKVSFVVLQDAGAGPVEHKAGDRPFAYLHDAAAPATTLAAPATSATPAFTVSWTATDGDGAGVAGVDLEVSRNGGPWERLLTGTSDASASFGGADGARYAFRARATDALGAVGAWDEAATAVDAPPGAPAGRAPAVRFTAPVPGAALTGPTTVRYEASDPDLTAPMVTVTLRALPDGAPETLYSGSAASFAFDPAGRADGDHEFRAVATDGTLASAPATLAFRIDRTAPDIKGVFATPVDVSDFVVTARVLDAKSVTLSIVPKDGGAASDVALRDDGASPDAQADDGVWTAAVTADAGAYDLRIVAEDASGNRAERTIEQTFLLASGAVDDGGATPPPAGTPPAEAPADTPGFEAVAALGAIALAALAAVRRRRV